VALWRSKARSSLTIEQTNTRLDPLSRTSEIGQFYFTCLAVKQNIVWLNISMNNVHPIMEVHYSSYKLSEEILSDLFHFRNVFLKAIVQLKVVDHELKHIQVDLISLRLEVPVRDLSHVSKLQN
jgi:hypothetical protein